MKKIISALTLLMTLSGYLPAFAYNGSFQVKKEDIYEGYIVEKIWLENFAVPKITLSDLAYTQNVVLPKGAKLSDPLRFTASIGMERKKPFLVLHIPAYIAGANGTVNQVSGFSVSFTEDKAAAKSAARTTDTHASVLANGTWYRIGVTQTGFYKIDYNVITSMGLKPSDINPANIRVFGNGGRMLSEDNSVSRPTDLTENALWVNDNGNGSFDNGEFAVFYGVGTMGWTADTVHKRFTHLKNLYADTAYYFVSFDQGPGLRISTETATAPGNVTVTSYNYYNVHDTDEVNPAQLGKNWYGEQFYPQIPSLQQNFVFDMGAPVDCVYARVSFASNCDVTGSTVSIQLNNGPAVTTRFDTATVGDDVMDLHVPTITGACGSSVVNVGINFNPKDASGVGYLDFIELNARRNLVINGDQLSFRDMASVGAGNVASYQLQGANSSTMVWDITNAQNPVIMAGTYNAGTYTFSQDASTMHEFAAMNSTNLYTPSYAGTVPNQNLHGSGQVNLIIVTSPNFLAQANTLADYHRSHDNMSVIVATTQQIYNEFSSGCQDISAIRDFARMFYKRAGTDSSQMPSYLILFGGASYDYKNRTANNCNFVPVFESAESTNDLSAFSSDDFFGFLDDHEYIEDNSRLNALDIAIGRLPARNADDANTLVSKIMSYDSAATLGPWRISTTHLADKGCNDPAGDHMDDAEYAAATVVSSGHNLYNLTKVYIDATQIVSTPAGARAPDANAAINEQIFKGTFLINYNGHGNPYVLSGERIVTQDDYSTWNNANSLFFMVTATCDFGQFDKPQFVSSASQILLKKGGGAIALLTTTQAVYASYNLEINSEYLTSQLAGILGSTRNTFGTACTMGKNATYVKSTDAGEIANFRKFALLGDPAVTPDFPKYNVVLDSIVDGYTLQRSDTLKALGSYLVDGSIRDTSGNILTGFNGMLNVTFYDKPRTITTITGCDEQFKVQDNIVYKGRVTVTNGLFKFSFITPKDINYYFGTGKLSTYAQNGITDAAGVDTGMKVGGFSDHPVISSDPPIVKPYINDSLFLNGGITGSNTSLYVTFYDKTGINVSGSEVGHDLTAVLDGNVETPYILNDYYETAPNTYQYGYLTFPLAGLADGRHTITVKAWDVNNNVGEGTVDFIVVDGMVMDIRQLGNYPNPFNNTTHFVFEHNHPNEALNVQILIYSVNGALVKDIKQELTPTDSRTVDLTWDGTADNGSRLPSGVYVYRLNLSTDKGYKSSAYQKLVIVR